MSRPMRRVVRSNVHIDDVSMVMRELTQNITSDLELMAFAEREIRGLAKKGDSRENYQPIVVTIDTWRIRDHRRKANKTRKVQVFLEGEHVATLKGGKR